MKNIFRVGAIFKMAGIITLAVIMGFFMIACNIFNLPEDEEQGPTFSVSGKFEKTVGGEVQFILSEAGSGKMARQAVTEIIDISGELVDDAIIFRLSGTYNIAENKYTASASSSMIRYSINGAFDSDGNSLGSTATLLVRDAIGSDNWTAYSYIIDEEESVVISGDEYGNVVSGGIPEFAQGYWNFSDQFASGGSSSGGDINLEFTTFDSRLLLSQWAMVQDTIITDPDGTIDYSSFNATVIEAENKGAYWDIIFGVPFYEADEEQARAAVKQFLSENNLTAKERDSDDPINFWDPTPPWIQDWHAYNQQEPLPPWWLESFDNWNAIWRLWDNEQGKLVGLPPIPPQYSQYAFYFNHYYGTEFVYSDEAFPLPWWGDWAPMDQPLPPWLKHFVNWEAVYATVYYDIAPIPPQYQQYAWYYNYLYGTDFEYEAMPPWLEEWYNNPEPLPPWLQYLGSWDAVWNAMYYSVLPPIPAQFQQYAWYYNSYYGTDFAYGATPPWLEGYPGPEPLPPWLQQLGSWEAVHATMYYDIPQISPEYQMYAWYYNYLYGTDIGYPEPPPGELYYTIENGDVWFYSNGSYDWNKINRWYNSNYLEIYLIGNDVKPVMFYTKMRATFSSSNTKMHIRMYGDGSNPTGDSGFYETVQEARNVTSLDPNDEGITLTR